MTCQSLTRTSSLEQPTIRSTMRNRKKSGRARPNCNLQISFARVAMQMKLKTLWEVFNHCNDAQCNSAFHSVLKIVNSLITSTTVQYIFQQAGNVNLQNKQSCSNENDMRCLSSLLTDFYPLSIEHPKLACLFILDALNIYVTSSPDNT